MGTCLIRARRKNYGGVTMTAVIAHRGSAQQERENTIAAFLRAKECGADGVEFDALTSLQPSPLERLEHPQVPQGLH